MDFEARICQRIIEYYLRRSKPAALEVGTLFLQLAEEKISKKRESSLGLFYEFNWWIKRAGYPLSEYLKQVGCFAKRQRISRLLSCLNNNLGSTTL